jgi:SAM-dependent methyltransferase
VPEHIDRAEGRRLFGLDPQGYDASRPEYPAWIFERLCDVGALRAGASTLEIGAGSGRASRELLARGADPLTMLEPDPRFAESLEALAEEYEAACRVIQHSFEDADLPTGHFDLVVAATAFHWVEQGSGLRKIRRILANGGRAALFWNVLQDLDKADLFHAATQQVLSGLAISPSGAPNSLPFALDRVAREADLRGAGFEVEYTESKWTLVLDTERVGKLYEGFSPIQRLEARARAEILAELVAIADEQFGGRVERNITSCLYLLAVRGSGSS